ncbi:hypothetical protein CIB48_g5357 [Xylaria polymorpha]|nr:hypothetical protein CIB48_g5357 [Xylaria polymorpha]
MSSARASGNDAGNGGAGARPREHNQGNQERKCTPEQRAAVQRIRRCKVTAFYEILDLEATRSTCTDSDIKKAYRKQSLLTHPDKNGHEHADEAFKMVSKAFSVLGDKEKRDRYDRFGTDPESRFESARAQAQNPFGGFGGRAAGGGGPLGFDTGPQFVFNVGGNRGFRVHQFGGGVPRRRPRADGPQGQQQPQSGWDTLVSFLPILFLPLPPQTYHRTTPKLRVDYFVDPNDIAGWQDTRLRQLDKEAELGFVRVLRRRCDTEIRTKQDLIDKAQGWFFPDPDKMKIASDFEMGNCKRLESIGISRKASWFGPADAPYSSDRTVAREQSKEGKQALSSSLLYTTSPTICLSRNGLLA